MCCRNPFVVALILCLVACAGCGSGSPKMPVLERDTSAPPPPPSPAPAAPAPTPAAEPTVAASEDSEDSVTEGDAETPEADSVTADEAKPDAGTGSALDQLRNSATNDTETAADSATAAAAPAEESPDTAPPQIAANVAPDPPPKPKAPETRAAPSSERQNEYLFSLGGFRQRRAIAFSAECDLMLYAAQHGIYVLKTDAPVGSNWTAFVSFEIPTYGRKLTEIAVNDRGNWFAYGTTEGAIHFRRFVEFSTYDDYAGYVLNRDEEALPSLEAHTSAVRTLEFLPGSNRLVSGGDDGQLKLWNTEFTSHSRLADVEISLDPVSSVTAHAGGVNDVASSSDASLVASAGMDHQAAIWRVADDEFVPHWNASGFEFPMAAAAFAAGDTKVVFGGFDKLGHVWTIKEGASETTETEELEYAPGSSVTHWHVEPHNGLIHSVTGGTLTEWNLSIGTPIRSLPFTRNGIAAVAQSKSTRTLYLSDQAGHASPIKYDYSTRHNHLHPEPGCCWLAHSRRAV